MAIKRRAARPIRAKRTEKLLEKVTAEVDMSNLDSLILGKIKFGSFLAPTDSSDVTFSGFGNNECARLHDGGTTQSDTDMSAVGHGLGFKKPIISGSADSADKTVTLSAAQSGAIIQCDADTNNIIFNLPQLDSADKAGIFYTFVVTTAVHATKTITINTYGTDGNDKICMYRSQSNVWTQKPDTAGHTITIPSASPIGTVVEITAMSSGASNAAEVWFARAYSPSTVTNT